MGDIYTVAGNGAPGTPGENNGGGGAATAAQLNQPFGVAVTTDGGFLIADTGDNEVRQVAPEIHRIPPPLEHS